jgi:hypothetical protein
MAAPAAVAATNSRRFIAIFYFSFGLAGSHVHRGWTLNKKFFHQGRYHNALEKRFSPQRVLSELSLYLIDEDHRR